MWSSGVRLVTRCLVLVCAECHVACEPAIPATCPLLGTCTVGNCIAAWIYDVNTALCAGNNRLFYVFVIFKLAAEFSIQTLCREPHDCAYVEKSVTNVTMATTLSFLYGYSSCLLLVLRVVG